MYAEAKDNVMRALKDHFSPEFLNRLDDIVLFNILEKPAIKNIVGIQVDIVRERLEGRGIKLKLTEGALDYLADKGYDPHYGARPLKRLIQSQVLTPIANQMITGDLKEGATVTVGVKDEKLTFESTKPAKKKKTVKTKSKTKVAA